MCVQHGMTFLTIVANGNALVTLISKPWLLTHALHQPHLSVLHHGHAKACRNHTQSKPKQHDRGEHALLEASNTDGQVGPRLTDDGDEASRWVQHP